jgi:protein-S-isoprenylcysteine O-methyltransferase Ste14
MAQTSVPDAGSGSSDAEKTADALQTWGAVARAACVLLGVVGLMFSLPVALAAGWLRVVCTVTGAVVLIAAGCWIYLWHDAAAQVVLQLDGIRRDLAGLQCGAEPREGGSGETRDEQG